MRFPCAACGPRAATEMRVMQDDTGTGGLEFTIITQGEKSQSVTLSSEAAALLIDLLQKEYDQAPPPPPPPPPLTSVRTLLSGHY